MCVKNKPRTRIFASERNIKNELEKIKNTKRRQETTVSIQKRIAVPFLLSTSSSVPRRASLSRDSRFSSFSRDSSVSSPTALAL